MAQELNPINHLKHSEFVNFIEGKPGGYSEKIIFSDKAHFNLSGHVNKQNCRIWGDENPRVIGEKLLHSPRVTVWCGFWSGSVIGPYFFQNGVGDVVTVNGLRYREMLAEFYDMY